VRLQVGNKGGIKTLQTWLQGWEHVHLHGGEAGTAGAHSADSRS